MCPRFPPSWSPPHSPGSAVVNETCRGRYRGLTMSSFQLQHTCNLFLVGGPVMICRICAPVDKSQILKTESLPPESMYLLLRLIWAQLTLGRVSSVNLTCRRAFVDRDIHVRSSQLVTSRLCRSIVTSHRHSIYNSREKSSL